MLRRQPWYLTPETVVLSLCSDRVADEVKSEMASKILSVLRPGNLEVGSNKAVVVDDKVPPILANFIDEGSWLLFNMLDIRGNWLDKYQQE